MTSFNNLIVYVDLGCVSIPDSVDLRQFTDGFDTIRSMSIYSFMIAVRSGGEQLTSESGETTSHLMGIFYRTLRMVENGVKSVNRATRLSEPFRLGLPIR